jgi:hypothetical protein
MIMRSRLIREIITNYNVHIMCKFLEELERYSIKNRDEIWDAASSFLFIIKSETMKSQL